MTKTKTILAATLLFAGITGVYAQTETTAGTWRDTTLTPLQRNTAANKVLTSGTDAKAIYEAAAFMLQTYTPADLLSINAALPEAALADPTLGGKITKANDIAFIFQCAADFKIKTISDYDERVTFLRAQKKSPRADANMQSHFDWLIAVQYYKKAVNQLHNGDAAGALATFEPHISYKEGDGVLLIARCKVALRAADALSWAKAAYLTQDFAHTQDGINVVASALRQEDGTLARANAFIELQKSGTGTNPIAEVPLPKITFIGHWPETKALNATFSGDADGAILIANTEFAAAAKGEKLDKASELAVRTVRNKDFSPKKRADAYAEAINKGEEYKNLPELKKK